VTEAFLHYLWKYRLLSSGLSTISGDPIEILNPGFHNLHAGPDFGDARLRIADTIWAGNVEIHVHTSDWFKHGHHNDPVYDNVVLHVVLHHDMDPADEKIPVLELQHKFDQRIYEVYKAFMNSGRWVPCINLIHTVPEHEINLWLERMLIERLERKADIIQGFLALNDNDWEGAFYFLLARSFGFNLNTLPFEMMARSLPFRILARHAENPMQVEALIFGQAGLLSDEYTEPWPQQLFAEYSFLRKKYQLVPIAAHLWRFMRLRPVNFPTVRLAQFSSLIAGNAALLSQVLACETIDELKLLFDVSGSVFWDQHYHFGKSSVKRKKHLGENSVMLLIINAVLPFMFVYGRSLAQDDLCNRALSLYHDISGESNTIIQHWQAAGLNVKDAFNTQALIGLKTDYCDKKRCLECRIGNILLKNPDNFTNAG